MLFDWLASLRGSRNSVTSRHRAQVATEETSLLEDRLLLSAVVSGEGFQVNSYTTGSQHNPSVAAGANGDLLFTWTATGQDGSETAVYARRFTKSGIPLGNEFQVNQYTFGGQDSPSVAYSESGEFIITWSGVGEGDDVGSGIFARRFSEEGIPLGDEFRVNDTTAGQQSSPSVATSVNGSFVIAWHGQVQDGSDEGLGVYAKLYGSGATSVVPEFRVNSYTSSDQRSPSIGMDASGNFVIAWQSDGQDHPGFFGNGVYARRYSSAGISLGDEFRVNTNTTSDQFSPSVSVNEQGDFAISWTSSDGQDGSDSGVFAKAYSSAGEPTSGEFQVNNLVLGFQLESSVAIDKWGWITVVWQSGSAPLHGDGIYARRFRSDGNPFSVSFLVSATGGERERPSLGLSEDGNFVIAWNSDGQDGSQTGVFARHYLASKPETIGAWRTGAFFLDTDHSYSWNGVGLDAVSSFGATSDKPLSGDWNGDGYSEIGAWRSGAFFLDTNGNGLWDGPSVDKTFRFGISTDTPIVGDWNKDGKDEIGVWRSGKFYLDLDGSNSWNSSLDGVFSFGAATDTPLIGDWNADGIDDLGVWRAGRFYLDLNANRAWNSGVDGIFTFGNPTDTPLTGDWNGDGTDDIGVWRSGKFYLDANGSRTWNSSLDKTVVFGSATDKPLIGYWKPKPSQPPAAALSDSDSKEQRSPRPLVLPDVLMSLLQSPVRRKPS